MNVSLLSRILKGIFFLNFNVDIDGLNALYCIIMSQDLHSKLLFYQSPTRHSDYTVTGQSRCSYHC